jgi:hypothetical protein
MTGDVLALDIATTCGWARGACGGMPTFGSVAFAGRSGASEPAIFANALRCFSDLMRNPPQLLVIEALLPAGARIISSKATRDRLAGLRGIALGVANCRGVFNIIEAQVGDVRAHFISDRSLKRHKAKTAVMQKCRGLGWAVEDDNAGDACAIWSYGCGLIDPRSALRVSPLFQRGVSI